MSHQIALDVGGTHISVSHAVLDQIPYFRRRMASLLGRTDQSEEMFVDLDYKIFRHILNWVRNPSYEFPADEMKNIIAQMQYLLIDTKGFIDEPKAKPKRMSTMREYTVASDKWDNKRLTLVSERIIEMALDTLSPSFRITDNYNNIVLDISTIIGMQMIFDRIEAYVPYFRMKREYVDMLQGRAEINITLTVGKLSIIAVKE